PSSAMPRLVRVLARLARVQRRPRRRIARRKGLLGRLVDGVATVAPIGGGAYRTALLLALLQRRLRVIARRS
ncbi:MAG TPA: hypothetical protein VFZ11_13250, partial [Gemmatimonadaceae bacterium]